MIVDIGGGTTEVAIISLADISVCESIRVAGDDMDEAIVNHMKRTYNLMIGEQTAERIKIEIGSAAETEQELTMEVRGRDMISGLPRKTVITSEEVREALKEPVGLIIEAVVRDAGEGRAGTGGRPGRQRHLPGRRRGAAARPGPGAQPGHRPERAGVRRPADLRRPRHGHLPREPERVEGHDGVRRGRPVIAGLSCKSGLISSMARRETAPRPLFHRGSGVGRRRPCPSDSCVERSGRATGG